MLTDYGFIWGPMEVMRAVTYRGRRWVQIETGRHKVQIGVSPQGNNIIVYMDNEKMEVVQDGN